MRRLLLLLLAFGWGILVFWGIYDLIYVLAEGDLPIGDILYSAIPVVLLFTLPLLVGAAVVNAEAGWRLLLRWSCAVLLVVQVLVVLILGIVPPALPPLLGAYLLLRPKASTLRLHWRQWLLNATLPLICLGLLVWWQYFHFPLPSDAAMTAHFNEHRAEFEQLVKGYRDFRRYLPTAEDYAEEKQINDLQDQLKREKKLTPEAWLAIAEARRQLIKKGGPGYEMLPDVKALKASLGVYRIIGAGRGGDWYPDHYSTKTAQTVKRYMGYWLPIKEQLHGQDGLDFIRRELPSLFEATTPVRDFRYISQLTEVIELHRGTPEQPADVSSWRYRTALRKNYYHFPQPPRVEDGHVLVYDFLKSGGELVPYKCRFFHPSPPNAAQIAGNASLIPPGMPGQASGCPGLTGSS